MIPVPGDAPPLVFLGPSAPVDAVRAILPEAEIRPPVRRGDLYQARLLRYSVFVMIDGVFAQREAIPPREVVDVLQDGAAVIGASSMGALRAADCHPAGAVGLGGVYRAFRTGAVGSEDEVAVVFDPDNPFPALSQSLVGIRFAVRRGVRAGWLTSRAATSLIDSACALPYAERTWPAVIANAGIALDGAAGKALQSAADIKQQDAISASRWVARKKVEQPTWFRRPRLNRGIFSGMAESRERPADGLLGNSPEQIAAGFLLWMLLSGRSNRFLDESATEVLRRLQPQPPDDWIARLDGLSWSLYGPAESVARSISSRLDTRIHDEGSIDGERFRHAAIAEGIRYAISSEIQGLPYDIETTEHSLLKEHGVSGFSALEGQLPPGSVRCVQDLIQWWSRARACRRAVIGG